MAINLNTLQASLSGHKGSNANSPQLKAAAHEFEASLMQVLLKPLQQDPLFAPDNSGDGGLSGLDAGLYGGDGSAGALMSFGSEQLADAISKRGGFGIATMILNHFRTQEKEESIASHSKK